MQTPETNTRLVLALYQDLFTEWKFEAIERYFDPQFTSSEMPASLPRGPTGVRHFYQELRAAFPDLRYIVEDTVAEADKVVVRWRWSGHHTGPFRGLAPTGSEVKMPGIAIYQLASGKAVRRWVCGDTLSLMLSLGMELRPKAAALGAKTDA